MIKLITKNNELCVDSGLFEDFTPESLLFLGMRTVVRGTKAGYSTSFYHTLPIEHTDMFPVEVSCNGSHPTYSEVSKIWLAEPLIHALTSDHEEEVNVTVERKKEHDKIIILNCLDSCYGHALDKLFNIQRHLDHHAHLGLVVIIQSSMRNLVPEGVSEIWELDTPFKTFEHRIKGFDQLVKTRVLESKEAYLSRADMNLDYSLLRIPLFVKHNPLRFDKLYEYPARITFILREDRFWLTNKVNHFLYLVARKLGQLSLIKFYFIILQNRNFRKLAKLLVKQYPDLQITAIGIGSPGGMNRYVQDLREPYQEYRMHEDERYRLYSESHLIFGVHGSHMILPSALAGAFISLHQDFKIPHFSEDFIPRHSNPQRQAFLGRFLSDRNSPKAIASHIKNLFGALYSMEKTKF